jgi:hypothetical protein
MIHPETAEVLRRIAADLRAQMLHDTASGITHYRDAVDTVVAPYVASGAVPSDYPEIVLSALVDYANGDDGALDQVPGFPGTVDVL